MKYFLALTMTASLFAADLPVREVILYKHGVGFFERWGTVGVSPNVIEASWQALVDSIEYKLYKDRKRQRGKRSSTPVTPQT